MLFTYEYMHLLIQEWSSPKMSMCDYSVPFGNLREGKWLILIIYRSTCRIHRDHNRAQLPEISHMKVSWNRGTPKSSTSMGFSIQHHPFGGTPFMETLTWMASFGHRYSPPLSRLTSSKSSWPARIMEVLSMAMTHEPIDWRYLAYIRPM